MFARFLRALPVAAGAVVATAALNRSLRAAPGTATNALGGTERRWNWRGHDIFVTEAGSGPLVLLVHGIYAGSSSFEYRHVFPLLAARHRVVAFDLLGNGLSDRPNIAYDAELFVAQIVDAIAQFGPTARAVVASSLGAAFAIRAAARAGARVERIVAVCPTGLVGTLDAPPAFPRSAITSLFCSPLIGEALFNALASRPSLAWFLTNQAYGEAASVTPAIVDHYWAITHQRGARYVPAHFVGGALNCSVADALPDLTAPLLVAWGELARGPSPIGNARAYVARAPGAELATFPQSGLLPHEEEPQHFADRVERFVESA